MLNRTIMIVLLIVCLGFINIDGEEKDKKEEKVVFDLGTILITATKIENSIKELPLSASVIKEEEIKETNAKQTTDVLEMLPGVFIKKTSAFGRADVDIRGIGDNGRQLGVFIDGRPDKMGLFGCSVTHTLPMNNVEKIEVIRGPESVLYGSEAFGGVINIITKRSEKNIEGNILASYGTFNTQNLRIQQGMKIDSFDYFLSYDRKITDGHTVNSAYNSNDFTGQIGYSLSKEIDISFGGKYFTGRKNEPAPSPAGTWNDYRRGSLDLTCKYDDKVYNGSLKLYNTFGEHTFSDGFHSKDYTYGVMGNVKTSIFKDNELKVGGDGRYQIGDVLNTMPKSLIGEYYKWECGVYLDDKQTLFDKLTIDAGARYNYDKYAKDIVNYRAGVVYTLMEGTILRGIFSQGFRSPQLNDLYLWGGNPDLKPERVNNYEVGIRQEFGDNIDIDMGYFIMKGSDLIQTTAGKKQNIGEFEFKGFEATVGTRILTSLELRLNYSNLNSGTKTKGRPGDKFTASVRYSDFGIKGLLNCEYVANYFAGDNATNRINDYFVMNAQVDYDLKVLLPGLSVFFAVDNILDRQYQIYVDGLYTMPGRSFTLGTTYSF